MINKFRKFLFRLIFGNVYVVTMYRGGNTQSHSYVIGVFSNKEVAENCGDLEKAWRGEKYSPMVSEWSIDGMEFDRINNEDY